MTTAHTTTTLTERPRCAFNDDEPAYADAKVPGDGRWGYVCKAHFVDLGCQLGLGLGQRIVLSVPDD